eukprot:Amastigsp_a678421_55.p1 type:complete len:515 gc:universal Amastigsp_a678421_55:149-1693(+)
MSISAASLLATLGGDKYVPPARRAAAAAASTDSEAPSPEPGLLSKPAAVPKTVAPSRVLHWTRVLGDMSERDLLNLVVFFGTVVRILIVRSKKQAFMEVETIEMAKAIVEHFASTPPTVRGRPLCVRFSAHAELVTRYGDVDSGARSALPATGVLLVTVRDVRYSITADVLAPLLRVFGRLNRVIVFTRDSLLQALVEYADRAAAGFARERLHGQSLFAGCCTLEVQCSRMERLKVRTSSPLARDYTRTPLSAGLLDHMLDAEAVAALLRAAPSDLGEGAAVSDSDSSECALAGLEPDAPTALRSDAPERTPLFSTSPSAVLAVTPLPRSAQQLFHLFSCYGNVVRIVFPSDTPSEAGADADQAPCAFVQMDSVATATLAQQMLCGVEFGAVALAVGFAHVSELSSGPDAIELAESPLNRFTFDSAKNRKHVTTPSPLLHISNLAYTVADAELERLCASFGAVSLLRVFEHRGRRQALVRFGSLGAAVAALAELHDLPLEGRRLRVSFSDSVVE